MNNLFMAIYEEHKQRTGHDIFKQGQFSTLHINCNVCLYLKAEKRKVEKEERQYYENIQSNDV